MTHSRKNRLIAAYTATRYCIALPAGECVLRVGEGAPMLDQWLRTQNCSSWAYLTADNPGSKHFSDADNALRRSLLLERVAGASWMTCPGVAVSDNGDWADEHGVLIAGIPQMDAIRLAREFGQNALLVGVVRLVGEAVELCWVA